MTAACVIPARGGSRGVPRKNLQTIRGQTLLARAIATARAARQIDTVWVSTEDDEIAREAARCGAGVIERPPHLASDTALTDGVLLHASVNIEPEPQRLCLLQCTAPFVTARDIDRTVLTLERSGRSLAIAATQTHGMFVRQVGRQVIGVGIDIDNPVTRRQDRQPLYRIAGSVWVMTTAGLQARGRMYTTDCVLCEVAADFEIDTPEELELARLMAEREVCCG